MAASRSTVSELTASPDSRRRGRARRGGQILQLAAAAASRLSLRVELEGGARLDNGAVLDGIEIDVGSGSVRLGRCRFDAEGGVVLSGTGTLVFLDDVHDCRGLIADGQCTNLRSIFQNVPLVLGQRERIRAEFREFCSNLVYDLAVYKRFFDEQDRLIFGEPEDVANAAREILLRTEGRRFLDFLDRKVAEMNALIVGFTPEEHERHGFFLRRQIWPYLMGSAFLQRTNLKPRGYAGDAELMIMLYENAYVGTSMFDQLMHKHPVETLAADAVRFRRALIPRVLREVVPDFPRLPRHGFRVLSLAAGPAWELYDVVRGATDAERLELTFLDQDSFALELARETVRRVEAKHGVRLAVRYLRDSVRTMLRSRDLRQAVGRHHFVYSMGLFDYLTTPVARAVLAKAYDLVEPGGTLLVGNYHVATPTRWHMAYWADWSLVYRTEEGFVELARELAPAPASTEIIWDESRCQMFMRVRKPG